MSFWNLRSGARRLSESGSDQDSPTTAFCRIEHYQGVVGPRISTAGGRLHGPTFSIRFFDRIQPFHGGSKIPLAVSLYLKHELLNAHWNGRFLAAQFEEAAKPAHYAHCYYFGRLVPYPTRVDRLVVEVQTLDHLAFTVRAARPIAGNGSGG